MSIYTIENEKLTVKVASFGAELVSVVRKADKREFIWGADPDVWKRYAPVLFPIVGKCKNGVFRHEGKEYRIGQHGFARDMEFELAEQRADYIALKLVSTPETRKSYPFDFEFICSFKLEESSVVAGWEVVNLSAGTMYFSVGGHPGFVGAGQSLNGSKIRFMKQRQDSVKAADGEAAGAIRCSRVTKEGYLRKEYFDIPLEADDCITITDELFSRDALVLENSQFASVAIIEDGKNIVRLDMDAPLFGVWSFPNKGNRFVCIEPWYGRCDAEDFEGELKDREWGNTLGAGERFKASYRMTFGE